MCLKVLSYAFGTFMFVIALSSKAGSNSASCETAVTDISIFSNTAEVPKEEGGSDGNETSDGVGG